jgi:hypothetical protein
MFDSTAYLSKLVILQSLELLFFGFRAVVTAGVIRRRGTRHDFKIADNQSVSCQSGEGDLKKPLDVGKMSGLGLALPTLFCRRRRRLSL